MKLIETIDISNISGIFNKIRSLDSVPDTPLFPWLTDDNAEMLDELYYLQHSGEKCISRYYERYRKMEDDGIVSDCLSKIAQQIMLKFGDKWNRLYDVFVSEQYKPLENYDMKEKETPNLTRTKNVNVKTTVNNDVYGFNSSTPVPSTKSETSGNKLENEEEEKNTGTRDLERHGNIGVTSSQQLLQSELDLRDAYNFYNDIMRDVDTMLCLLVY